MSPTEPEPRESVVDSQMDEPIQLMTAFLVCILKPKLFQISVNFTVLNGMSFPKLCQSTVSPIAAHWFHTLCLLYSSHMKYLTGN